MSIPHGKCSCCPSHCKHSSKKTGLLVRKLVDLSLLSIGAWVKCGEKRMAHRKFDAWHFPKPAVCGIFHSPRNSENCRIAHVHVQTVGLFNPRLVFGAHAGHSVWECMVSERLSPCQVPVSFISLTLEHVPQGGAKCAPITLHCSTIYLRISQLCRSLRSRLKVLMWTWCLLCLWSTGSTPKPKALIVADKNSAARA